MTTISTRLTHALAYTQAADNPLTIAAAGGILAASGGYALSLGGAGIVWSLDQQGTVSAAGAIGVTVAAGSVTNLAGALIEGANDGLAFDSAGTLVDAGTISGARYAVSFAAGVASLAVVDPRAVLTGTVHGGGAGSSLEFASAAALGTFSSLGAHYTGFASYEVASGARWLASGNNTLSGNSSFLNAGSVTAANAIVVRGGVVTNSGFLESPNSLPLDVTNANVTNQAGGIITGKGGIRLHNGGTLLNSAMVAGFNYAAKAFSGATIVNQQGASITSGIQGIILDGAATLINDGFVGEYGTGSGSYGVFASSLTGTVNGAVTVQAGVITNQASGTIAGYIGISETAAVAVVNEGIVSGSTAGVYLTGGTITNAAHATVEGGGTGISGYGLILDAGTISGGGAGYALSLAAATASRVIVDRGAAFIGTVSGGGMSTLEFSAGIGTLAGFGSTVTGFADLTLDTGSQWLLSGSAAGFGGETIGGFAAGSTIELTGTAASYATLSGGVLTLSGGMTLDLPGAAHVAVNDGGGNTFITACFAAGTRLAGGFGPVPVEALREGDLVRTVSGRLAPVRWIGFRRTELRRHARPYDVMPVRIRAGAFDEGVPLRDVVLSPDHAVLVAGRLIPIRYLVNGVSIAQETREAITYWHVELDRHDVLLAEGLACESYLDTGNRSAFANAPGAVAMTPDFARAVWATEGCAPIVTDPADPTLRALHTRLLARGRRLPARSAALRSA